MRPIKLEAVAFIDRVRDRLEKDLNVKCTLSTSTLFFAQNIRVLMTNEGNVAMLVFINNHAHSLKWCPGQDSESIINEFENAIIASRIAE